MSSVKQISSDSPLLIETREERTQRLLYRRLGLVRILTIVLGLSAFNVFILGLSFLVLFHYPFAFVLMMGSGVGLLSYIACWFFTTSAKKNIDARKADIGCYFLLCGAFISTLIAQLTLGTQPNSILAGFMAIPILAGIIELGRKATIATSVLIISVLIVLYCVQIIFKVYKPDNLLEVYPVADLFLWVLDLGIAAVGVHVFTQRLRQAALLTDQQNEKLGELLQALATANEIGAELSQELSGVAAELNVTSQQQASSSQEQAAAVTQVTSSLTELTGTATQIASSASDAAQSAIQTVAIANEVKNSSNQAETTAFLGNEAVEQVLNCVEQVQLGIDRLTSSLAGLTEQAKQASGIIDIIDDIAGQTHLLALNAFIEAAGSSSGDGNSTRGDRFGVIAQEVKNLADSSKKAAHQVRQTVTQMRDAVADAVLVADESSKQAFLTVTRSRTAGIVIEQLTQAISNSVSQADQILAATEAVRTSGEAISMATLQQHATNEQILTIMQGVTEVSKQNAQAVVQLSHTAARVYQQIDQLNLILSRTREASLLAAHK